MRTSRGYDRKDRTPLSTHCKEIEECLHLIRDNKDIEKNIKRLMEDIVEANKKDKITVIMGNGGSAADAQHFAAELVCTFENRHRKGIKAVALNTDTSILTAWSNDFEFESVFERQVETLGKTVGVCIGLSTSGKSKNVINALRAAKKVEASCWLISGNEGEQEGSTNTIRLPSKRTATVQTLTQVVYHTICSEVESRICGDMC